LKVERFIDLGDQVLTLSYFDGKARDEIEVRRPLAHLWTLRDGKVIRMNAFQDHHRALEAVGLAE
jgi:ketosteroid isomerase-like protein